MVRKEGEGILRPTPLHHIAANWTIPSSDCRLLIPSKLGWTFLIFQQLFLVTALIIPALTFIFHLYTPLTTQPTKPIRSNSKYQNPPDDISGSMHTCWRPYKLVPLVAPKKHGICTELNQILPWRHPCGGRSLWRRVLSGCMSNIRAAHCMVGVVAGYRSRDIGWQEISLHFVILREPS